MSRTTVNTRPSKVGSSFPDNVACHTKRRPAKAPVGHLERAGKRRIAAQSMPHEFVEIHPDREWLAHLANGRTYFFDKQSSGRIILSGLKSDLVSRFAIDCSATELSFPSLADAMAKVGIANSADLASVQHTAAWQTYKSMPS